MVQTRGWSRIEAEARHAFSGEGRFPLPAYSELMPAPYVGIKPYQPRRSRAAATAAATAEDDLDITEYEQTQELAPGLERIAGRVLGELAKLCRGKPHDMSRTLLAGNPAWPPLLREAATKGRFASEPIAIALALSLSRTQDDKGNVRWTLFGASHEGPAMPFWRSYREGDGERFLRCLAWAAGGDLSLENVRVLASPSDVPLFARALVLEDTAPIDGAIRLVVTFRPFEALPAGLQEAYVAGRIRLFPSPASLAFFEHSGYRKLARTLPRAMQIPLLHLFPRVEGGCSLRIPQSGWLDEVEPGQDRSVRGHKVVRNIARSHRWQRRARDQSVVDGGAFTDPVTVALFSANPDDLGLYGKPMARNAQVWREDYELLLDGPRATPIEIERASQATDEGGRFGYRFLFPPMRAGRREIFWHRPIVARLDSPMGQTSLFTEDPPLGYLLAEPQPEERYLEPILLAPRLLDRPGHREAAALFQHEAGHRHNETCNNVRKLLEMRQYLSKPLPPSLARALLRAAKDVTLDGWIERLPSLASDHGGGERVSAHLRGVVSEKANGPGRPLTFDSTATREFEERIWHTIASLAESDLRMKDNADTVAVNQGRTGGANARKARVHLGAKRDLAQVGADLHERYRKLIAQHGMTGQAQVVDHLFHWNTEFAMPWSSAWVENQLRQAHERNVVLMIPGRDRGEAVIMADHYDTAYMEDVFEAERGGDGLRAAAAGADDNASATSALLAAGNVLLPMARAGMLGRDVWLVHLTGEEFPSDCLGARALAQAFVQGTLRFTAEDGAIVDATNVHAVGAFVLDMIAHNNPRDRDVFQIAPGEGAASARLALAAHLANERWNRATEERNARPERKAKGRAQRMQDGRHPPPPFSHLALHGEIRTEWEPRSSLYNTDGQIFSDLGIPVVLFMENYDISRSGYHDTEDTMANIDLDYAAALSAIAIETVATVACEPRARTIAAMRPCG